MANQAFSLRPGTMDHLIIQEMERDPYGVQSRLHKGVIVIDAGANIGAFARYVLKLEPEARILCIEPMPDNVKALRANLVDFPQCEIIPAALMGEEGKVILHDYGMASSACHSVLEIGAHSEQALEVQAVTLGGIMVKHDLKSIDILKIDVQGAEYDILCKCSPDLLSRVCYIAMEVHASIANATTVLGEVPDYIERLIKLKKKLSRTHICVRGYPVAHSAVLGWALRETCGPFQILKNEMRLKLLVPLVCLRIQTIRYGSRICPKTWKTFLHRLMNTVSSTKSGID